MGQALPKSPIGKMIPFEQPRDKDQGWHHDWRGKLYHGFLWCFLGASGGLAIWFLTPLHRLF